MEAGTMIRGVSMRQAKSTMAIGAIAAIATLAAGLSLGGGALAQQQPLPAPGTTAMPAPPDRGATVEDLLAPPDQGFLLTMEAWQRRIAVLSLALRATELEVQRAEQERRLRELQVETDSIDVLSMSGLGDEAALTNLPPMLQGLEQVRQAQQELEPPEQPILPIRVQQIRGVGDNLVASVATDDGLRVNVRAGDFLPDGRPVLRVSSSAVTVRELSGRENTYGLRP